MTIPRLTPEAEKFIAHAVELEKVSDPIERIRRANELISNPAQAANAILGAEHARQIAPWLHTLKTTISKS